MDINKLTEVLKAIKNGVFTRIAYTTDLPVKSLYKKAGIRVVKETEATVRLGVKYKNIKSVKERLEEKSDNRSRKNNYKTILPNKLVYNTNTEKYYVCAFPTKKGTHTKQIYKVILDDLVIISSEDRNLISHLVIDSYWKKNFRETFRVNAENILRIGESTF